LCARVACACDNEFGKYGTAPPSQCDVDGDGAMDCGMWADEQTMRAAANAVGPAAACALRNAVYSILQNDVAATCVETATGGDIAATDTDACAAVTGAGLADATACDDVKKAADANTKACTYAAARTAGEPTPVGCYREGGAMPTGLTLFGDAYLDVGGGAIQRFSGGVGLTDVGQLGDDNNMDDFGIHFDGTGDYATVSDVDAGYAADGTFAISLWATRPSCSVSGWPEILYSHWAKPGDWRAPGITVAVLCADTLNKWFGHSTAQWRGDDSAGPPGQCLCEGREFSSRRQIPDWDEGRTCGRELDNACKADAYDGNQGAVDWVKLNCCGTKPEQTDDVIRVNMVDASGNRAMFDVPMREADSGGFVDDMWVHFMLSVERAPGAAPQWGSQGADVSPHAIKVYVDGDLQGVTDRGFRGLT
jgi:hypothetical protein